MPSARGNRVAAPKPDAMLSRRTAVLEPQPAPAAAPSDLPNKNKTYIRPYKKSTNGCIQCKTRKIKCNEEMPCGNCRRRFVDSSCCKYGTVGRKKGIAVDRSSVAPLSAPLRKSPTVTPVGLTSSNHLDLRLIYHYTISTGSRPLLVAKPSILHSMWDFDMPQVAFSSEIVLNALLGMSALNLLSLNPSDTNLAAAARSFYDKAIVKQRNAVGCINRDNAEPLLLGAVLLAHFDWISSNSGESEQPHKKVWTFRMCQGVDTVLQEGSHWLQKYGSLINGSIEQERDSYFDNDFLELAVLDMANLLKILDDTHTDPDVEESYNKAADEITAIYSLVAGECRQTPALEHKIVSFLHRVPECFVKVLEEKDPLAMAIFARNVAMLELLEDKSAWWIHGAGSCSAPVNMIYSLRNSMPSAYMWTLDFPLKIVTKEIKLSRSELDVRLEFK